MGLTHIRARISNPARPRAFAMVRFLVDSGAIYSVIPAAKLKRLGIEPLLQGKRCRKATSGVQVAIIQSKIQAILRHKWIVR